MSKELEVYDLILKPRWTDEDFNSANKLIQESDLNSQIRARSLIAFSSPSPYTILWAIWHNRRFNGKNWQLCTECGWESKPEIEFCESCNAKIFR